MTVTALKIIRWSPADLNAQQRLLSIKSIQTITKHHVLVTTCEHDTDSTRGLTRSQGGSGPLGDSHLSGNWIRVRHARVVQRIEYHPLKCSVPNGSCGAAGRPEITEIAGRRWPQCHR